ncbi:hypothetical protein AB0H86_09635 [Streptomyces sp. NPDC050997]|uniref:hypothetical protein n=1 Tax=Streptomyces sp. NPDC050997 TaxID=3155519 RepID=UPI003426695F
MQRKGVRGSGGHDAEGPLDELYTTPPPHFVTRREELAAEAKADGRMDDARLIHAARRPTLAAWAANVLLRSQPVASQRFLELGRALREAYRTLDADGIKELSDQRREIVSSLSRQAAALAREAGHPLSDAAQQDVASTLHAVLADQAAADRWAAGRLRSPLTPPADFPSSTAAPAGAPRTPTREPTAPRSSQKRTPTKDELAQRRRQRQEQLTQARKAAKAADRRLREQHAEQADADASMEQARDRHDQARQQVSAAEGQLRQAREQFQKAEQEQQAAEERCRAAADAVARAEQAVRDASQEVERLATPVR